MSSITPTPTTLYRIANGRDIAAQFGFSRSTVEIADLKKRLARAIDRKMPLLGEDDADVLAALILYVEAL